MYIQDKKKLLPLTVIVIGLLSFAANFLKPDEVQKFTEAKKTSRNTRASKNSKKLYLTKHAQCRMGCREISKSEVLAVLDGGRVNSKKSNRRAKPCPVLAKELRSADAQLIRVVYADCQSENKIITVIDLENEYRCDCR